MKIGIVGAGIAGRMLAWRLSLLGHKISLFDKNEQGSQAACSFAAAGILSPFAEVEQAEKEICQLGKRSMQLYPEWLSQLEGNIFYRAIGSLVTAHGSDKVELQHFAKQLEQKVDNNHDWQWLDIGQKETSLNHLGQGLYIPSEGQIDPIELMESLENELTKQDVDWHWQAQAKSVETYRVKLEDKTFEFDYVFDCRGLGAKKDLPLRAVRGELLWLEAPDVNIQHLTRLMHPRYRIYIVPRPNNIYLIGATEIESEDYSELSVRSSLELLSAAYSVDKGFAEARIMKSVVNCRPALPDNLPLIECKKGLGKINGLYRHGILLAPAVIEKVLQQFATLKNNLEKQDAVNG